MRARLRDYGETHPDRVPHCEKRHSARAGAGATNLGLFVAGALTGDGEVVSAVGAPDATLFHALEPGRALIDLFTGDPWRDPRRTTVAVEVRPAVSSTA
jgi:hypothetical protein